jgi:predicted NAD-dependent protein-ADP-ribosyltransferase YbiA (DUF1768 family)
MQVQSDECETRFPCDKNSILFFKSNYVGENKDFSNFKDCTLKLQLSRDVEYPSVEHAYQAMLKVCKKQRHLFQVGGVFADWDRFELYCKEKRVRIPPRPRHGLIGWIAKIATAPPRFTKLGLEYTSSVYSEQESLGLLCHLLTVKFSEQNPRLLAKLIATKRKILVEGPGRGGRTSDWEGKAVYETDANGKQTSVVKGISGRNLAGKCIMAVRKRIQQMQ